MLHLLQNARAIGTHGGHAQMQHLAQSGRRFSLKPINRRTSSSRSDSLSWRGWSASSAQVQGEHLRQCRAHIPAARQHLADRLNQFFRARCLCSCSRTLQLSAPACRTGLPDACSRPAPGSFGRTRFRSARTSIPLRPGMVTSRITRSQSWLLDLGKESAVHSPPRHKLRP